ncbi:Lactam utilization protein LamB [hydrothermal vent metagenome]|uniref:Lactam utilization protein LamB n=1 Tax=hydrothermal vent metagenome TaxID=652676 RepID=A0A3B0UDY5_9ZZZZ
MKQFEINCDVGEGIHNEDLLMPYIQSCNIACKGHAGNDKTMSFVVELAIKHNVKIGAHPSYPDKVNFGRKTMIIEKNKLKNAIQNQINSLLKIIEEKGATLHHIKPHGALYNDLAKNNELASQFLESILPYKKTVKLYVPYNSVIEKKAKEKGFVIIYEAFADRNYNDDLSLVSRKNKEALITNKRAIFKHILEMLSEGKVTAISGNKITIKATTFCVHSDTENAVEIVKYLSLKKAGKSLL